MRRTVMISFILITMMGCTGVETEQPQPSPTEQPQPSSFVFTYYSTSATSSTAQAKAMEVFAEEIEDLTNGQIRVEVLTGEERTSEEHLSAIRTGALDMANVEPYWLTRNVPSMSMFGAAYLFRNVEHMTTVMNGEVGKTIYTDVAGKSGIRPLSTWYWGTRQVQLGDVGRVVTTPADMRGLKLRVPRSVHSIHMVKALGAEPIPIAVRELYMALQQGIVDGHENTLPVSHEQKLYEVAPYTILTGHYVHMIMPVINEQQWQALGPVLQAKMDAAMEKARWFCQTLVIEEEEASFEFLKAPGRMIIFGVNTDVWRQHVREYYLNNTDITRNWDMELYHKIQSMAE